MASLTTSPRKHRPRIRRTSPQRTLKPENALVFYDAATNSAVVKLSDFGSAIVTTPGASNILIQPADAALVGTLAYVTPEILRRETYDGRVDVWALGIVLFSMITTFVPWTIADQNRSLAFNAVIAAIQGPLSVVRTVYQYYGRVCDVPVEFVTMLDSMLEVHRFHRSTATHVVNSLEQVVTPWSLTTHGRLTPAVRSRARVLLHVGYLLSRHVAGNDKMVGVWLDILMPDVINSEWRWWL